MATVTFDKTTRHFPGADRPAVDSLDLEIGDGEFLVLVGPSGCGKSTSLRMLAGLEEVDAGAVLIGDRDVTALPPKNRDIAMVFQNYALYPHMSVGENMAFALKIAGVGRAERVQRVREAARMLGLEPLLDRRPKALSGGQRQRVAMGRALTRQPKVFLMDEPLSNLDAKLRVQTRAEISALQRRLATTMVYVTQDQVEAMTMGDRVAILRDGRLQQVDTPRAVYERPANVFVAGFIGSPAMNFFSCAVEAGAARAGELRLPLPTVTATAVREEGATTVTVGIRPEALDVVDVAEGATGLTLEVDVVESLGGEAYVYGRPVDPALSDGPDGSPRADVVVRVDPRFCPVRGERVRVAPRSGDLHAFSTTSGRRLPS